LKRVRTLIGGKELYVAAEKVFDLPPWATLMKGPEAVEAWRSEKPLVYGIAGNKILLITKVPVAVMIKVNPVFKTTLIDFGPRGSGLVAEEVIRYWVELDGLPFVAEYVEEI